MPARLLLVHAHPDDESIGMGATIAAYAARGVAVTLVTCTLGEEGEVIPPALRHLTGDALGKWRIGELARACAALGVSDHRFLGGAGRWRDSGMAGTAPNDDPRAFARSGDEAVDQLAAIVAEVRPDVVLGYDAFGGYGHPDHVRAHQVMLAATADVPKVYYGAVPASVAAAPFEPGPFTPPVVPPPSVPDAVVTTRIDGPLGPKVAAMRAHATQIAVAAGVFALSDLVARPLSAVEHYTLARGELGRTDGRWETDLFG